MFDLTAMAASTLGEGRRKKNIRHRLLGLLRQAVYGRLAGYEDVNDAERLARDPVMRAIVGATTSYAPRGRSGSMAGVAGIVDGQFGPCGSISSSTVTPLSKQADPQRPLSGPGRLHVAAMGRLLAGAGIRPTRVVHSGKRRARETELLAAALGSEEAATAMVGLDPRDPVEPLAHALVGSATDTMLVGHLPFLARLAGRLVTGDEDMAVAAIAPATVLCLEPASERRWAMASMVRPKLAPGGT